MASLGLHPLVGSPLPPGRNGKRSVNGINIFRTGGQFSKPWLESCESNIPEQFKGRLASQLRAERTVTLNGSPPTPEHGNSRTLVSFVVSAKPQNMTIPLTTPLQIEEHAQSDMFWFGFDKRPWASRISARALAPLGVHAPNQEDHGAQHQYRKRPYDHRRPDE